MLRHATALALTNHDKEEKGKSRCHGQAKYTAADLWHVT